MFNRMMDIKNIIEGCLLGDGSIRSQNNKYFSFKVTAKDIKFAEWLKKDNPALFSTHFYINSSPYPEFTLLKKKWYKRVNGRTVKRVPNDLLITPATLLFWYLGDGSLIKRKNDPSRIPFLVLATNAFSKKDINLLIQKLKDLGLNFYPVKYKSGFTGKDSGYCLYSKVEDGTPFRFFKLIGFDPPEEIADCSCGRKGRYKEEKSLKDKWPTQEDWIKILSNLKEIGKILRKRRLQLGLSQNQLARKIGIRRENIRDVELCKRNFSVKNFRKVLQALGLKAKDLLKELIKMQNMGSKEL